MQVSSSSTRNSSSWSLLGIFRGRHARARGTLLFKAGNHLEDDETPLCTVFGVYKTRIYGVKLTNNAILIATNRFIVFFANRPGGYELRRFEYESVSSVELSQNMMGASINIRLINGETSLKWIQDDADDFVRFVKSKWRPKEHNS